jgi:hypothetical protein
VNGEKPWYRPSIAPTLLEYFGQPIPSDMQGKPLKQVINNDTPIRDGALFGQHGAHINVTDGRYTRDRKDLPTNTAIWTCFYVLFTYKMANVIVLEYMYICAGTFRVGIWVYSYTQMPTHMYMRFLVEEMRTMTVSPPFSFTKGTLLMKIDSVARMLAEVKVYLQTNRELFPPDFDEQQLEEALKNYDFKALSGGTSLYDVVEDPKQEHPIEDAALEEKMAALMKKLMKENDAPPEQFERLGLLEN